MFENKIIITGRHGHHIKFLKDEALIFSRYIDVYMCGAVFGLLYGEQAEPDKSKDDEETYKATIMEGVLASEHDNLELLYRLVMLLDETESLVSKDERLNRAFRDDADANTKDKLDKNVKLFNSYVLGGIDKMYKMFTEECTSSEDYMRKMFEVVSEFQNSMNDIDYNKKLESLLAAN